MTEPSPCPNYEKVEGCACRHCRGVCFCHREPIAVVRPVRTPRRRGTNHHGYPGSGRAWA